MTTSLGGIIFNPRPTSNLETDFKTSQIENLQASLSALNNSLIHLQQNVISKDEEINELKGKIKEKKQVREDKALSLVCKCESIKAVSPFSFPGHSHHFDFFFQGFFV